MLPFWTGGVVDSPLADPAVTLGIWLEREPNSPLDEVTTRGVDNILYGRCMK